jgi:Tat protein secretion system quality control protein TatD with DNase activity
MPENVAVAYQSLVDQYFDEDTALNNCKTTANVLEKMDKDVDNACIHGKGFACFTSSKNAMDECLALFFFLGLSCSMVVTSSSMMHF